DTIAALRFRCEPLQNGELHPARPAPRRPEIDERDVGSLLQGLVEGAGIEFGDHFGALMPVRSDGRVARLTVDAWQRRSRRQGRHADLCEKRRPHTRDPPTVNCQPSTVNFHSTRTYMRPSRAEFNRLA